MCHEPASKSCAMLVDAFSGALLFNGKLDCVEAQEPASGTVWLCREPGRELLGHLIDILADHVAPKLSESATRVVSTP